MPKSVRARTPHRAAETMPLLKPPLPTSGSPDDTEQAFYDALRDGDLDRAMAVWADDDDIVCILPGGGRCVGAVAIRSALGALLAAGGYDARPQCMHRLESHACAIHGVLERADTSAEHGVFATNVYWRTVLGWHLVAHHASHGSASAPSDGAPTTGAGLLH